MRTTDSTAGTGPALHRPARSLLVALPLAAAVAVAPATGASAAAPQVDVVVTRLPAVVLAQGAGSPCDFDITFTSTGTIRVTTFLDGSGAPVRSTVHGSLLHTLSSDADHVLSSDGPAPVHMDLTSGQSVDTGLQFRFRSADGVVLAAAGRLVSGPDGSPLSFAGLERVDPALCTALAP
jgi:hypothetical protein